MKTEARGAARPLFIVLLALLALALLLVLLNVLYRANTPAASSLPPSTITVQLLHPANDTLWPANTSLPVRAAVTSTRKLAKVELFINDVLIGSLQPQPDDQGLTLAPEWRWLPGAKGYFILKVRATDVDGTIQESAPVRVAASAPSAPLVVVTPQPGDTIGTLAGRHQLAPAELVQANPGPKYSDPSNPSSGSDPLEPPDPNQPLQPGSEFYIPQQPNWPEDLQILAPPLATLPVDIQTLELPDDFILTEPGLQPAEEEQPPAQPGSGGPNPPGDPALVPPAPKLDGEKWMTCSAMLYFTDPSNKATGFKLYHATLTDPQFSLVGSTTSVPNGGLGDPDTRGLVTYIATAYNDAGESEPSPALSLEFTDPLCFKGSENNPDGIQVDKTGVISIPPYIQLAYAYYNIDSGPEWKRAPADPHAFFPPDTTQFDPGEWIADFNWLGKYGTLKPYFSYSVELWGWVGGKLYNLGKINGFYGVSVVKICDRYPIGPEVCTADLDKLVSQATVAVDSTFIPREVYFATNNWPDEVHGVVVQVSMQPFPKEAGFYPPGLVWSWFINGSTGNQGMGGSFTLDLYNIKDKHGLTYDTKYWGRPNSSPAMPAIEAAVALANMGSALDIITAYANQDYYIRILPVYKGQLAGRPSNTAVIHYGFQQKPVHETPAQHLPDIYDIEITDFTPPDYALDSAWGCVIVTESSSPDYHVGWKYCPNSLPKEDCDGLLDEFKCLAKETWKQIKSAWDSIVGAYEWLKNKVAEGIASLINYLFPGACDQSCQDVIATGVGFAISYVTGIPPSLPSSGELLDKGLAGAVEYGVSYAAEEIGPICDDFCKSKIRSLLEEAAAAARAALQPGPACNADEAVARGLSPYCLPAGVAYEPAPHAIARNALVGLRITRKAPQPGETALTEADAKRYRLDLTGIGINNNRIGTSIKYCAFDTSYTGPDLINDMYEKIIRAMEGELFAPEHLNIPWLEPGESIEFVVPLKPGSFKLWKNCSGDLKWAHMYLYYLGVTQINADVLCEDGSGQMNYCGESEMKQILNPWQP